jgi:hypothetical protein
MQVYFRVHAQQVMERRGVTPAEVEEVVRRPEVVFNSPSDRHPKDYRVHQLGELAVVVKPIGEDYEVVTILWRNAKRWTDEEMREGRS